jgi:hypothetical protein
VSLKLGQQGSFPPGLTSIESGEVMRKSWELYSMASDLLSDIINDPNSTEKFHYTGVVGRDETLRQAEHQYLHGSCQFYPKPYRTVNKKEVLRNEIVNISVLDKLAELKIIAGCLNQSAGGDGSVVRDSYVSDQYTCYEYHTRTPYEGKPNSVGLLKYLKYYKKCPKITDKNGKHQLYWFCAMCYKWLLPSSMKSHISTHFAFNVPCSNENCKRMFRNKEIMEYHVKMAHVFYVCTEKHFRQVGNAAMNLYTFRNYHLPIHHDKEIKKWNVDGDSENEN